MPRCIACDVLLDKEVTNTILKPDGKHVKVTENLCPNCLRFKNDMYSTLYELKLNERIEDRLKREQHEQVSTLYGVCTSSPHREE